MKDYNNKMEGVDKHDMFRQLYEINRNSMKWWHRAFLGLLHMSTVNACIRYKEANPEGAVHLLQFRRHMVQVLLTFSRNRNSPGSLKRHKIAYTIPESVRFTNAGIH